MRSTTRLLILFAACIASYASQAQLAKKNTQKSPLQLGDQYFAAGEYYTAANLYGQYLNPPKQKQTSDFPLNIKARRTGTTASHNSSRTEVLYKQAESYRLANYWQEAANAYKECTEADPNKYLDAFYWLAVSERSLGHYDSAKEYLKQYLDVADESSRYYQAAKKELETLEFIQQQLQRADSVLFSTKKLDIPNSGEKGAYAPALISGNKFLLSSTVPDSQKINGVNPYHSRLFTVSMNDSGVETMERIVLPGDDATTNQGAATISTNGKYLYFSQWKKEKGQTVSSVYYAAKLADGWSTPIPVPSINATGSNTKQPFCSSDGKYLFFASDRPGGSGGFDIWYAPLKEDGSTGEPVNAGSVINTKGDEQAPFYHNTTNTLVFSSNGKQGMGGYDLFAAKGSEATWQAPENLGNPVNSPKDDIYFFAPEQSALLANAIVGSDRSGCCLESYKITKAPKNKRLSGTINECPDNKPAVDAKVVLKDISGKTWNTVTDSDGRFVFDIGPEIYRELSLIINKDQYLESASLFRPEKTDETDLLTDNLINVTICITPVPEEKPAEQPEPIVIKAEDVVTVFFEFDKSLLKGDAISKLDSIYQVMVENPDATIQISGYTDGMGSAKYNQMLSDKRAKACANYLVKKGIAASRVTFVSFGSCCPVEMELINGRDNPDGRSKNRRALINVKKN